VKKHKPHQLTTVTPIEDLKNKENLDPKQLMKSKTHA